MISEPEFDTGCEAPFSTSLVTLYVPAKFGHVLSAHVTVENESTTNAKGMSFFMGRLHPSRCIVSTPLSGLAKCPDFHVLGEEAEVLASGAYSKFPAWAQSQDFASP